jgi:cytochrome P450
MYHLAKNPDKQEKLFQEIHRHLPGKEQPVTSKILDELKYLKACIKESMRSEIHVTLSSVV